MTSEPNSNGVPPMRDDDGVKDAPVGGESRGPRPVGLAGDGSRERRPERVSGGGSRKPRPAAQRAPSMKWAAHLGRFAGIDVYVHATFSLLIIFVILSARAAGNSLSATMMSLLLILSIFLCVVLHEFGHALMARRFGVRTRDITLYPIGGVARLERMPERPWHEFLVAIAGPAVNVVIAGGLGLYLFLTGTWVPQDSLLTTNGGFVQQLMMTNVFLVLFNMLPAFPMDGGRVVRALLAMKMDYSKATNIAAGLGQVMAFLFAVVPIAFGVFHPILMLIAFFVWMGAGQEAAYAQMKSTVGGVPVRHAMVTRFEMLRPTDSISRVCDLILESSQQDFPVMDGESMVGVVTRGEVLKSLARDGDNGFVADVMMSEFYFCQPTDMLDAVVQRVQETQANLVAVLDADGRLVGLLTMENVGEFVAIRTALKSRE